jgi:predicted nucleic acid-binding Zn ribbon protein
MARLSPTNDSGPMANHVLGKSKCAICGRTIAAADSVFGFSAIFPNEAEPLHIFHDAVAHEVCFKKHPLRKAAEKRVADYRQNASPRHRHCRVCGQEILNPDDHLGLGHLTDDPNLPIGQYNFAQFHRSCVQNWQERSKALALLENMIEKGEWRGNGLHILIENLRKFTTDSKIHE